MLFKDYHIDQIRDGEKTVTRREWEHRQVKPGGVYIAATEMFVSDDEADCYVRVTDVYEQPLGDMDDEDARREGDYETLEEFRDGYERVYAEGSWDPEKVVWVVEFEYVGRSRPEEQTKLVTDGGEEKGLFDKYVVEKDGEPVENCFVLEPENDEAAREAVYEYARATDNQKLASELRGWVLAIEEAMDE